MYVPDNLVLLGVEVGVGVISIIYTKIQVQ